MWHCHICRNFCHTAEISAICTIYRKLIFFDFFQFWFDLFWFVDGLGRNFSRYENTLDTFQTYFNLIKNINYSENDAYLKIEIFNFKKKKKKSYEDKFVQIQTEISADIQNFTNSSLDGFLAWNKKKTYFHISYQN